MANFLAKIKDTLQSMHDRNKLICLGIGIFVYIISVAMLIVTDLPNINRVEVGKPAPWDIKASR